MASARENELQNPLGPPVRSGAVEWEARTMLALGPILESIRDAVFVHDADGRLVYVNRTYLAFAGRSAAEVLGRPYWEVFPRRSGPLDSCRTALRDGGVCEEELREGDGRVLRARAFTVSGDGAYHCSVHVMEDVTERRRGEDELRRANADLERFAFAAAHDLKAPLRAVHMLSELIDVQEGPRLSLEGRRLLGLLRTRVRLMDALIEGLLEYAQADGPPRSSEPVASAELLAGLVESLQVPASFRVDWDAQMPCFVTDRTHLRQVFAHLLDNAVRHHDRDSGHIHVAVRDIGPFYEFAVSDDGPGVPPAYRERVFDLFQHGPGTRVSAERLSTGIGLAVVKKTVEGAGGRVTLEPGPERGVTFRFSWPKVLAPVL